MTRRDADDISFTATVRADRMRFNDAPDAHVEFTGTTDHESTSERIGFPDPVQPGVTYSTIRVDYRLGATVEDPTDARGLNADSEQR